MLPLRTPDPSRTQQPGHSQLQGQHPWRQGRGLDRGRRVVPLDQGRGRAVGRRGQGASQVQRKGAQSRSQRQLWAG